MNKYGYITTILVIIFLSILSGTADANGPTINETGKPIAVGNEFVKIIEIEDPDGINITEVLKGSNNLKFSDNSVHEPKGTYKWKAGGSSFKYDKKPLDGKWELMKDKAASIKITLYVAYINPHKDANLTLRAMGKDQFWSDDKDIKNDPATEKEGSGCAICHESMGPNTTVKGSSLKIVSLIIMGTFLIIISILILRKGK